MPTDRPSFAKEPWQQARLPVSWGNGAAAACFQPEERGAVFTRREVVNFILDLAGYTPDRPLHQMRLLEPSVGQGDFLLPVIDRLLTAWRTLPGKTAAGTEIQDAIRGVELHPETFLETREQVISCLHDHSFSLPDAARLAATWLIQGDFLLVELTGSFHFAVGNPPYVRQELIPDALLAEYRARYSTIYDRADLYVPFIERSLALLEQGGQLGFICADRWMKNRYGGPLRQVVSKHFHLKTYVDMVDTPAFQAEVTAYPAITIISRAAGATTRIAHRPDIAPAALAELSALLTAPVLPADQGLVRSVEGVVAGAEPWILEAPDQLALVRRLEADFPTLEEAGCKVGIGVATGADHIFVAPYDALDVEPDRKLPLVTTRDIVARRIEWHGLGVINPFMRDGSLVRLEAYPRLQSYLEAHRAAIARRHVAQKNPTSWYRTIDRIDPALAATPKLLIPDIKGAAHVIYEAGMLYPHHNLYYITSQAWDLLALQSVLNSGIARLFVSIYSTRMRGGYMRFQAQYLRRIRIPHWHQVPELLQQALTTAVARGDQEGCNQVIYKLYGLSEAEQAALGGS